MLLCLGLGLGLTSISGCANEPPAETPKEVVSEDYSPEPHQATVLFIGTSLTAGYGLNPEDSWVSIIQRKMDEAGLRILAVNAGVSGETSAGALRRIEWLLADNTPDVVMLETGANDGLRGLSLDALGDNIDLILTRLAAADPKPILILAGMEALPNMGREYTNRFRSIYPAMARKHGALYLPFLLEGVAGNPRFNQSDGIHPNAEGARRVAENVWAKLEPVLASVAG